MLIQTDFVNDLCLPFDDINYIMADEDITAGNDYILEIDGTGKLQIVNTGGASAAEGGMGSSSDNENEKGDLQNPANGEKGGKPNKSDTGWDPMGEKIDKETAKKQQEGE